MGEWRYSSIILNLDTRQRWGSASRPGHFTPGGEWMGTRAGLYVIHLWLYSPCGTFQFLNPYTVCRTPWTGDQPVARPLPTHRTTQKQNKRIQTSMSRVGFKHTIPVFERAKTVHALDRAATVTG
jgi:hypothetical protein